MPRGIEVAASASFRFSILLLNVKSVPHATTNSDIYNGYYIPRGAIVLPNIWGMCHDERLYNKPNESMPQRFLTRDGVLLNATVPLAFGFGRRICVGRALADSMLWIGVVSILSVFDIKKAKDESGQEIGVSAAYSDGALCNPLPFQCSIKPRSLDTEILISTKPRVPFDGPPLQ